MSFGVAPKSRTLMTRASRGGLKIVDALEEWSVIKIKKQVRVHNNPTAKARM
jgi:hypothetical protein